MKVAKREAALKSVYTDDDDSAIADLARLLGINLKFTSYTRYCTKA